MPGDIADTLVTDLNGKLPPIPPDSIVSRTFYTDEQIKAMLFGDRKSVV